MSAHAEHTKLSVQATHTKPYHTRLKCTYQVPYCVFALQPSSALLVPYGVGVPLESYLDRYKTLQAIVLIGDGEGAQNPMIDAHVLESQASRWKVTTG